MTKLHADQVSPETREQLQARLHMYCQGRPHCPKSERRRLDRQIPKSLAQMESALQQCLLALIGFRILHWIISDTVDTDAEALADYVGVGKLAREVRAQERK